MRLSYHHVRSHQDRVTTWANLPLDQQVNVVCDVLAGSALHRGISIPAVLSATGPSFLPLEKAALIVTGVNAMADVTDLVRHMLGREAARGFFTTPIRKVAKINVGGLGWSHDRFDLVDWEGL